MFSDQGRVASAFRQFLLKLEYKIHTTGLVTSTNYSVSPYAHMEEL